MASIRLKNKSGDLAKRGLAVESAPNDPTAFIIARFDSSSVLGIVSQDIPKNATGEIITSGEAYVQVFERCVQGSVIRPAKSSDNISRGACKIAKANDAPYFQIGTALTEGKGLIKVLLSLVYIGNDALSEALADLETEITERHTAMNDPTGFENRTDSAWTFTDGTRKLEITTVSGYNIWFDGVKHNITATKDITITDAEGIHVIYFDTDDTLKEFVSPTTANMLTAIRDKVIVAVIYWDATNNVGVYVGEERHGCIMDGITHYYLHYTRGLQYISGLGLDDFVIGDGSLDSHAQFSVDEGSVADEDVGLTISAINSTTGLPVLYMDGANGYWRTVTQAGFACYQNPAGITNRLMFNEWTGAIWQLTEVSEGDFVLYHIFATTGKVKQVYSIMGQSDYATLPAARAGAEVELNSLVLGSLPSPEMRPIATVIYQTDKDYGNSINARIVEIDAGGDDYVDWRTNDFTRGTVPTPVFLLNGQSTPQTLTVGSGLTHQTTTSGQTFGIATSYSTQFAPIAHSHTQYAIGSLFAGTNISGTINSTAFQLSVAAPPTILSAHAGTAFSGTNISGTINSTAIQLSVAAPVAGGGIQSINGLSATAQSITVANSGGLETVATATNGVTFGIMTSYGAQFAVSAHTSGLHEGHAGTAFTGTNVSATLNSTGVLFSVAASGNSTSFGSQSATPSQTTGASSVLGNNGAWVTVVTAQTGNFLSTNADTAYAKNSLFAGTNISGTLNSTAFNLSVAAPPTILAAHAGTAFSGTNISGTVNSTGIQLSVGAGVGGGIQSINGQSATAQTFTVQSGLALSTTTNAWTFGLSSNYTAASNVIQSGASTSFLAADGTYRTLPAAPGAAPGNISNYVFPSDVFHGNIVTTLSTPISTNITIRPIKVTYNIEFTKMEWPVSIQVASTTNTTARTQQLRHTAVIYSKNGAILSPIVGAAVTYSYTVSSASTGSVAGARFLSAPLATTLTPGDYWVGIQAQTAGVAPMTLNHILVSAGSQMANFLIDGQSITTANFASTGPFAGFPLQGVIVASLSNTTNTWNISQISVAPATYYRANMIFQFKAVSY